MVDYIIAMKLNEKVKMKEIERSILSKIQLGERGSRSNRRFDLYFRGLVATAGGNREEALQYFQQTVSQLPLGWHWTDFEDCLGIAYLEYGNYDAAVSEFARILSKNPNYPLAEFHLGEAFEAKGMTVEASQAYRQFLNIWKDADSDIPAVIKAKKYLGI